LHSKTLSAFGREVRRYYASRDPQKAMAYNRRYGGSGHFGSYEAALDDPTVALVLIATPPALHLPWTLRALRSGKHVVVEKPPFLCAGDFDTVRRAQVESGRRVFVAENYYYKPVAERLRDILREDLIGEPLFLYVNAMKRQAPVGWREDAALSGGGALFEGGIHWVHFMANLGLTVRSVRGFRPGRGDGPDRSMVVAVEYEEGAAGVLAYSWEVPSLFRGLRISRIFGRRGSVVFESNGLFVLLHGVRNRCIVPNPRDVGGYRAMFGDFLQCLRTGAEPRMSLDIAERDLRLVEAVYDSLAVQQRKGGP
jgi:predicted dehydrogenase